MLHVTAIEEALDDAGLKNAHVRAYVQHWAEHTGADRIEVVNASDDARLIQRGTRRRASCCPRARGATTRAAT